MVTKKSSKSKKPICTNNVTFGKCFVGLALIIAALLFGLFYYMGQAKTHFEAKKLEAFETIARSYIYDNYTKSDGSEVANLTQIGVTDDDDLYLEFDVTKYDENHVPTLRRRQRVHFQCHDLEQPNSKPLGCAMAGWASEWEDVAEEEKEANRKFLESLPK